MSRALTRDRGNETPSEQPSHCVIDETPDGDARQRQCGASRDAEEKSGPDLDDLTGNDEHHDLQYLQRNDEKRRDRPLGPFGTQLRDDDGDLVSIYHRHDDDCGEKEWKRDCVAEL